MVMRRKTETLATVGLFRSLDDANIELLDSQCSWRRLSRNQWILDYQDDSNDVFFIVSGAVHVKLRSVSGREVLLREINAGDFFGELAAIDKQPRSAGDHCSHGRHGGADAVVGLSHGSSFTS
jgi:CRP/FNR family transcriptional regulator, cyclic AMP receptor protein